MKNQKGENKVNRKWSQTKQKKLQVIIVFAAGYDEERKKHRNGAEEGKVTKHKKTKQKLGPFCRLKRLENPLVGASLWKGQAETLWLCAKKGVHQ